MTLEQLKEYIKSVALSHKDVNDFKVGSDYNKATGISNEYPMVFYELPYFLNYNISPNNQLDELQFAFNVLVKSSVDNVDEDHLAISKGKEIGDAIVTYIQEKATDFMIMSVTGLSVREYTDDSVAGMRYEWTIGLPREYCNSTNLKELFNG